MSKKKEKNSKKKPGGRRAEIERRSISYTYHIPENRSGEKRRKKNERRSGDERRSGQERRINVCKKINAEEQKNESGCSPEKHADYKKLTKGNRTISFHGTYIFK